MDILNFLKKIELPENSKATQAKLEHFKANTHVHLPPNFSAFASVEDALNRAANEGVKVLGAGNYYDYSIYERFTNIALAKNIFPVFGTEVVALEGELQQKNIRVNDPNNPGRFYTCGKAITKFEKLSPKAEELLEFIKTEDAKRMAEMAEKLSDYFQSKGMNITLDYDMITAAIAEKYQRPKDTIVLQERHLAEAFQQAVFQLTSPDNRMQVLEKVLGGPISGGPDDTAAIQNQIRSYLMKSGKPCYAKENFVNLKQAQTLICQLGGIPCYPVLADGSKEPCEYEQTPESLIDHLKANNFAMVEFIPTRNSPEVLAEYVTAIRNAAIAVVSGTEHNTPDLIPVTPACKNSQAVPEKVQQIFDEGTYILAAHQYMIANGKSGFVDENGNTNSNFADSKELIETFANIGSNVIDSFLKQ